MTNSHKLPSTVDLFLRCLALAFWILIAVFYQICYVIALSGDYSAMMIPCTTGLGAGGECSFLAISPAEIEVLLSWGLTLQTYAIVVIAEASIALLGYFVLSCYMLWHTKASWLGLVMSFAVMSIPFATITVSIPWSTIPPVLFLLGLFAANLGVVIILIFFYLLPNGHFYPKWADSLLIVALLLVLILNANTIGVITLPNPLPLLIKGAIFVLVMFGLGSQVARFRYASTPAEQHQTKLNLTGILCYGLAIVLLLLVFAGILPIPSGAARLIANVGSLLIIFSLLLVLPFLITRSIVIDNSLPSIAVADSH